MKQKYTIILGIIYYFAHRFYFEKSFYKKHCSYFGFKFLLFVFLYFQYANKASEKILGYEAKALTGQNAQTLCRAESVKADIIESINMQVKKGKVSFILLIIVN